MTAEQEERLVVAFEGIAEALWKLSSCVSKGVGVDDNVFRTENSIYMEGISNDCTLHLNGGLVVKEDKKSGK